LALRLAHLIEPVARAQQIFQNREADGIQRGLPEIDPPSKHSPIKKILMFQKIDYYFLFAAFASFLASVSLWFLVNRDYGVYVGLWVPRILILWVGVRLVLLTCATANLDRRK
jgi:hypothetical protein